MSQYLVLSHINIQNANSIAGLTWGFPAITQFLGFTHALNRKISNQYEGNYDTELTGCGVISNYTHNKVYQSKKYADFEFIQSKNPAVLSKHKSGSPPIIEEGKMNLTVSLVIEFDKSLALTTDEIKELEKKILGLCSCMRVAGGTVLNIKHVKLLSASTQKQNIEMLRKTKRLTMPGFVLLDRSEYLQQHYQTLQAKYDEKINSKKKPKLLDAWLDFAALKFEAIPEFIEDKSEPDEKMPAKWEYVTKPNPGYLVPLMTGYKAISELYVPGQVLNTRDETTPSRFVEAIHSVGEWKSMHSIKTIADIIWRYHHDGQWYMCQQGKNIATDRITDVTTKEIEQTQTLNFNDALNLF